LQIPDPVRPVKPGIPDVTDPIDIVEVLLPEHDDEGVAHGHRPFGTVPGLDALLAPPLGSAIVPSIPDGTGLGQTSEGEAFRRATLRSVEWGYCKFAVTAMEARAAIAQIILEWSECYPPPTH